MKSLRRPADFDRVYQTGRVVRSTALRLLYLKRGDELPSRVAFVASKKLGSAVKRNRAKRLMRESWRGQIAPEVGWDFILIPNPRMAEYTLDDLHRIIEHLISRAIRQEKESS